MVQKIRLSPTAPYDFDLSFSYWGPNCPDPVAHFDGRRFQRFWPLSEGSDKFVSILSSGSIDQPELIVEVPDNLTESQVEELLRIIKTTLCLDLDLNDFYQTVEDDPVLYGYCLRIRGLKPVLEPDLFEALTWAIIGQQVNLRFACQVKKGMLEHFGETKALDGKVFYRYPKPHELAGLDPEKWRDFKCSTRKAEYVIGLAEKVTNGYDLEQLKQLADQSIIDELIQIRGIGNWTAEYVLIQGFGRFDALPTGDAGLLNSFKKVFGLDRKPTTEELVKRAECWRPFRGLATYYLWWGKTP